jgi:acyl-CoA thioesterase-1
MSLIPILAQIWCFTRNIGTWIFGRRVRAAWFGLALVLAACPARAAEELVLVAFGDSLTAGLGLEDQNAFPTKLEDALQALGNKVRIVNAGVSGDTTSAGLARLDWAIPADADAVIVELGANDALRGQDPDKAYAALDQILVKLKAKDVAVLLTGMEAPRNMGPEYVQAFNAIYPRLAKKHGVAFYPFFLQGVATDPKLNQSDGIHPNAEGVTVIVERILPSVQTLLKQASGNSW